LGEPKKPAFDCLIVSSPTRSWQLWRKPDATSKHGTRHIQSCRTKEVVLIVQVLWACHVFNATPEQAAQQVVADLFDHLARGGSVSVHVEGSDGNDYTLEVSVCE